MNHLGTALTLSLVAALGGCGDKPGASPTTGADQGATPVAAPPFKAGPGGVAPAGTVDDAIATKVRAAIASAHGYLYKRQMVDGSWGAPGAGPDPGLTAMVCSALLATTPGATRATHAKLWKGLDQVAGSQAAGGGIGQRNTNYVTSVAIMAFLSSGDPAFREPAQRAAQYVAGGILDTGDSKPRSPDDPMFGGAGYAKRKEGKPPYGDMSNTGFALEALMRARDAGLPFDEQAWTAATKFLERSQNRTESNDQAWASDHPRASGGFIYLPGETKAGTIEIDGKKILLPYGSMTYAGIKSFIYARVGKDDPRVKAAVDWVRKNFSLEQNPGFDITRDLKLGQQGLYYYFDTFAKAHHAIGTEQFADAKGVTHRWREELAEAVVSRQQADGSWVNTDSDRWMEGFAPLVTSYSLLALSYCLPAPK